jgi:hypothetical protein
MRKTFKEISNAIEEMIEQLKELKDIAEWNEHVMSSILADPEPPELLKEDMQHAKSDLEDLIAEICDFTLECYRCPISDLELCKFWKTGCKGTARSDYCVECPRLRKCVAEKAVQVQRLL